jgi:hypothetical protein
MTARPPIIAVLLTGSLLVGASLSGCGKMGNLDQPAPLYGAKAKADYDQKQRAAALARGAHRADEAPAPDPDAVPLTQAPYPPAIEGRSTPYGAPDQGSQPNTGANNSQ